MVCSINVASAIDDNSIFVSQSIGLTNSVEKGDITTVIEFPRDEENKCRDWQWQTTLTLTNQSGAIYKSSPFLWIPPTCKKIKAVIVSSTAVLEQTTVEDSLIRAVCAKYGIAILWSSSQFYHDDASCVGQIKQMLSTFSSLSGYSELNTVPWIPIGHSACIPMVRYIINKMSDRVAFAIMHKTSKSFGASPNIPIIVTNGEYMEWDSYGIDLKANIVTDKTYPNVIAARTNSQQLLSFYSCPNTGHFDCSKPLMINIANWIDAICSLRFDANGNLKPILQNQGWIAGLSVPGYVGMTPIPYSEANTNQRNNPWFPSQATAQAAYDMANVSMSRKAQIAGFSNAQGSYETGWFRAIFRPTIPTSWNEDGTFNVNSVPYFKMPQGLYPKTGTYDSLSLDFGKYYPFFNRNDTFNNSGNAIHVEVMSGNMKKINNFTFEYIPRYNSPTYLIVRQLGNNIFRSTVQPGQFTFTPNTSGFENLITFPAIADQLSSTSTPIDLRETSSSGLKVMFVVVSGPAHIDENNKLMIDGKNIPPRAIFPIIVTVKAYQLGSLTVKTPPEIVRTFKVNFDNKNSVTF